MRDLRVPKPWLLSLIVAALVVVGSEVAARVLISPLGGMAIGYWDPDAGVKWDWYRRQAREARTPDVVIIGDSTAARNLDPEAIAAELPDLKVFNLGWPANFPLALRASTFPLLREGRPPRVVILSQAVITYENLPRVIRFEQSILTSPAIRFLNGTESWGDRVALSRLYDLRRGLIATWMHGANPTTEVPPRQGFMPSTGGPTLPDEPTGNAPRVTTPDPDRLATVEELGRLGRERGIRILVTVPEVRGGEHASKVAGHVAWLRENADRCGYEVIEMAHVVQLDDAAFHDTVHLTPEGARVTSLALGAHLRALLKP